MRVFTQKYIKSFNKLIFKLIYSVHVVFGHVVSGQDLVRQLEQLPVDRNTRPLQDAVINNCGELIRQVKGNANLHRKLLQKK